MFLGSFNLIL